MRRLLLVLSLFLTVSCSSGTTSGILVLLTGTWSGLMLSTAGVDGNSQFSGIVTMNVTQDDFGRLSGIIVIEDPETLCWAGGIIDETTSSVTGSRLVINFEDGSGAEVTWDATASNNTIAGFYTTTASSIIPPAPPPPAPAPAACPPHSGSLNLSR